MTSLPSNFFDGVCSNPDCRSDSTKTTGKCVYCGAELKPAWTNLGDVCRKRLSQQAQYGCRWSETVAKGLRYKGTMSDYHSMQIHVDDVETFVTLVENYRKYGAL